MTDRELLEYAAKAAGVEGLNLDRARRDWAWDPLVDDGDAFRLMVKLNMQVRMVNDTTYVETEPDGYASGDHGTDPYAVTRRAVVQVASQIGREKWMQELSDKIRAIPDEIAALEAALKEIK